MNFKEMCRTCLRSGEMMYSIFDEQIEPAKRTAADLLAMFTSVQVDKEDYFPHKICEICLKEIQQAYLFDLKCKKSEIILNQLREISVKLKKLCEIPKRTEIVSTGEFESIMKEDFKLEDTMNQIVEEECTRDFQLAFKRELDHSNHFMKDDTNEKELERIKTSSNFQIVAEDCDPEFQITLKQENELVLHQNPSHFEILNECAPEYEVIFKTEPDQIHSVIKDNENDRESSEISSNFQIVEKECVQDFRVAFKREPELDIGIDCNGAELKCSACFKQFQSLDIFRGHIVSDHLEENICKLCNKEFECSQLEHSAKHLPLGYDEDLKIEHNEKLLHCETFNAHTKAIPNDEFFDKPDFQCKICSKFFGLRYLLVRHMRIHTGEKPFECELCLEKFGVSTALLSHKRTKHTDEFVSGDKSVPDFQCSICYKVFGRKYLLRDHMRVHTGEKPFQCKLCPEKFGNNTALLSHKRTKHTDEFISDGKAVPDFQCSVCYKVFGLKCRLRDHMRTHTGEKPFDCELCTEKFANSNGLLQHKRTKHTDELISDEKPVPDFQCNICYKVFGRKYLLRDHMRTHTAEKPFDCELCPEKFGSSNGLLYHKRTKHTDELINDDKPMPDFQCNICDKVFVRKCLLRNHMRSHTGEKPFDCKSCPEKFGNSSALLCHRRIKHTDEFVRNAKVQDFQCSVCSKVFGLKCRLRVHMRMHTGEKPFQCKLCPEKFRRNNDLLCHRRTKHTDEFIGDDASVLDFQCSVCNKVFGHKFRLRDHMRTHTGDKPFDCELCSKKFGSSNRLLHHRRIKHTNV